MRYPKIGEEVRVKNETGLHIVKETRPGFRLSLTRSYIVMPGDVLLDDGRILGIDDIITRHQKWVTVYVIQQHYGGHNGWEDVTEEELYSEARDRRKEYRENTNYPTRLIRRKVANQLYQGG